MLFVIIAFFFFLWVLPCLFFLIFIQSVFIVLWIGFGLIILLLLIIVTYFVSRIWFVRVLLIHFLELALNLRIVFLRVWRGLNFWHLIWLYKIGEISLIIITSAIYSLKSMSSSSFKLWPLNQILCFTYGIYKLFNCHWALPHLWISPLWTQEWSKSWTILCEITRLRRKYQFVGKMMRKSFSPIQTIQVIKNSGANTFKKATVKKGKTVSTSTLKSTANTKPPSATNTKKDFASTETSANMLMGKSNSKSDLHHLKSHQYLSLY